MSKTLVMKFGGTSVGSVDALKNATQIIRDAKKDWERVVVVTSAMSGVTNLLLDSAASASHGQVDSLPAAESTLREKHFAAADALGVEPATLVAARERLAIGIGMQAGHMVRGIECMAHEHGVAGVGVERAVGLVGELVVGERGAAEAQR